MGYRSTVTLLTKQDTYNAMKDALPADNYLNYSDKITFLHNSVGECYVRVDWVDVKWYYDNIERYLCELDDEVYWEFMRIGEDLGDIDYQCDVPKGERYRLYCRREIDMWESDLE